MMELHNGQATSECVSSVRLLWESVVDTRLGGMCTHLPLFPAILKNAMSFYSSQSSSLPGVLEGKLGVR